MEHIEILWALGERRRRPRGKSRNPRDFVLVFLQGLAEWIVQHLDVDLRVDLLAKKAGMSARNFARAFRQTLHTTPAKFVEAARLEQARSCLEGARGPSNRSPENADSGPKSACGAHFNAICASRRKLIELDFRAPEPTIDPCR